jgi:1-phosphatidylinositol phosphodiesterase
MTASIRPGTDATSKTLNPDQVYISFASATFIDDTPAMTPEVRLCLFYVGTLDLDVFQVFDLGSGTDVPGVNQKLLPWLNARKGQRFCILTLL